MQSSKGCVRLRNALKCIGMHLGGHSEPNFTSVYSSNTLLWVSLVSTPERNKLTQSEIALNNWSQIVQQRRSSHIVRTSKKLVNILDQAASSKATRDPALHAKKNLTAVGSKPWRHLNFLQLVSFSSQSGDPDLWANVCISMWIVCTGMLTSSQVFPLLCRRSVLDNIRQIKFHDCTCWPLVTCIGCHTHVMSGSS